MTTPPMDLDTLEVWAKREAADPDHPASKGHIYHAACPWCTSDAHKAGLALIARVRELEAKAERQRKHIESLEHGNHKRVLRALKKVRKAGKRSERQGEVIHSLKAEKERLERRLSVSGFEDVHHPWGDTDSYGVEDICELCWASDGDARCLTCGRTTGGPWACMCKNSRLGPCVDVEVVVQ